MESVTILDTMVNARKGKVTGVKKGKGASNRGESSRGGSSGNSSARESATDGGRDGPDVLVDAEDEEARQIEEEVERLRETLRSRRGSMCGTRESQ